MTKRLGLQISISAELLEKLVNARDKYYSFNLRRCGN